jgi:radical SAM superfamily enzyme YgiQ (UPF0313 family)
MHALIFGDNKYQPVRMGILRAPGAHRIATLLRGRDIQTEVVDFYLDWTLDELKQVIDAQLKKSTLFIAFSCTLMFDGVEEFHFIRDYIKSKNTNISIIIGGFGTLQKDFVGADWFVEGYGEAAIQALADHLIDNSKEIKFNVDDQDRKIIYTKDLYPVNDLTSLLTEYQPSDFIQTTEALSLETARGCIFKCRFCNFQMLGKKKLDYLRDPEEIRTELLDNYQRYGTTHYIITEDTFNDSDEKVEMLHSIVKSLPFKPRFMGYIRPDLLVAKPHNIKKLVESGFTGMHFGIETFNEEAGAVIGKGMNSTRLKEMLVNLKKDYPEVYLTATFIVGLPGETADEIRSTAQWILDSKTIDFWTFNPLMIMKQQPYFYNSEFSNNYLLYGFSKLTKKELAEIEYDQQKAQLLVGNRVLPHLVLWKNKYFDYFSAAELAVEINQRANPYKRIDAWTTFAIAGVGFDLDSIQKHTYNGINPMDQDAVINRTKEFVQSYKQQKLKYLTT